MGPSLPKVCVVTINWNGKVDTLACLESLRADGYPAKDIAVVDNGSSDDSVQVIRRQFPEVVVLEAGANLGFTGANNLGLEYAIEVKAKYIYWLNNDTVSDPNAIEALVTAAESNPTIGMLTPVIYYFDRPYEPWFTGSTLDMHRAKAVHENSCQMNHAKAVRPIPWASGCAMFAPVNLMQQLSGFDERFFLNWEDVDLSIRVVKSGSQIGIVAAAKIFHKVGRSFSTTVGTGTYYYVRNNLLLNHLQGPTGKTIRTLRICARHIAASLRNVVRFRKGSLKGLRITGVAIIDYLLGNYGAIGESGIVGSRTNPEERAPRYRGDSDLAESRK